MLYYKVSNNETAKILSYLLLKIPIKYKNHPNFMNEIQEIFKTFNDIKDINQITKFMNCVNNISNQNKKKLKDPVQKMLAIMEDLNNLANQFNVKKLQFLFLAKLFFFCLYFCHVLLKKKTFIILIFTKFCILLLTFFNFHSKRVYASLTFFLTKQTLYHIYVHGVR